MTADSIPTSKLGQRGAGFWQHTLGNQLLLTQQSFLRQTFHRLHLSLVEPDLREFSFSACPSGFATRVEARSPPYFDYNIVSLKQNAQKINSGILFLCLKIPFVLVFVCRCGVAVHRLLRVGRGSL